MKHCKRITIVVSSVLLLCGAVHAEYNRSGPAAGGGLESYSAPEGSAEAITSAEFRKLDCGPGETRVGRDSYYVCNGRTYKKDMICGRRMYVVVSGIPM